MIMRMSSGEFSDEMKCFGGEDFVFLGMMFGLDSLSGFLMICIFFVLGFLKIVGVKVFGNVSKKELFII